MQLCPAGHSVQEDSGPTVELQGPVCFMNVAFVLHALQQQVVRPNPAWTSFLLMSSVCQSMMAMLITANQGHIELMT